MKFQFCGDQDCPDWILAEIMTMAKLTSVKAKLFAGLVVQTIIQGNSTEDSFDLEKAVKLSSDAKFSIGDIKAVVGALAFIFKSTAKHDVNVTVLQTELQQLGLPKEHSLAFGRVLVENHSKIVETLRRTSFRLTSNVEILEWNITENSKTDLAHKTEKKVEIKLGFWNSIKGHVETKSISLSEIQLRVLLDNLKNGEKIIDEYL